MNPWITIWTKPRATISQIVADNPNRSLWLLAAIYGFVSLMNISQSATLGLTMGTARILILSVLLAPFYGYLSFTVWSWFVTWTGKWLKGDGNLAANRAAYAWSCVPIILNIPLWLLMVILFGHQLFLNFPNAASLSNNQVVILFVILMAKVVLSIWSLVIYLNALAEVQKFSLVKAVLNVIIAGLIVSIVAFVLWSLLVLVVGK